MTRTRVVVQSRLNSSRLPGKALMTIGGMPLVELVARRASRSGHEVVVATSDEHYDTRISEHLKAVGVPVMRGELDDVLGRFVHATADLDPDDRVVRLTGDNPVMDADVIDELLTAMDASGDAYGRVDIDVVPEGLGAEGFLVRDLRRAAEATQDPYDREHVTPWLRRHLGELLFAPVANPGDPKRFRCTVDTLDDFDRASRLFAQVDDPVAAPWTQLMELLAQEVRAAGVSVPERDSALGLSSFVYGGSRLAESSAPETRVMLSDAVARGVTHVEVGRADGAAEAVLRACADPQLVQRMKVISRLHPLEGGGAAAAEAGLERSFATIGRRTASAVVVDGLVDAGPQVWARLTRYRDEGTVAAIGVSVGSAEEGREALSLRGIGLLEVPLSPESPLPEDLRTTARRARVELLARSIYAGGRLVADPRIAALADELGRDGADDLLMAYALGHPEVSAVAVGSLDRAQLRRNLDLSARKPLSLGEILQVDERMWAA
ncbi:aldo/keto reductase [Allobranchiibius sp. GilTou73]|uniref:aldo/keto reductase n=1 Tax=Allobranchiibius sp. GilTou73 TaxID=2904523 RepID=UPI001F45DE27|nr:aldo/keto reductase [Allobranchiibius sp. GilTou73]UIJ34646.1 NTP transferase domain-containing protein [Allobranchiibius sp. GilTou73]